MRGKALDNCLLLALNRVVVDLHHLNQLLKCYVAYIVVVLLLVSSLFLQELAKDVDAKNAQAAACFDLHNSFYALCKHRDARLLCVLCVCRDLSKYIAHFV